MAISVYAQFLKEQGNSAAVRGMKDIAQRGRKLGAIYRALKPADKAALLKRAQAAKTPKRTAIAASVRKVAVAKRIPVWQLKKSWHATKGGSTSSRLNKIAASLGLKPRTAKGVILRTKAVEPNAKKVVTPNAKNVVKPKAKNVVKPKAKNVVKPKAKNVVKPKAKKAGKK